MVEKIIVASNELRDNIYIINGKKVMRDEDVAKLYGVTKGILNLTVKRNNLRFSKDFYFQLTPIEYMYATGIKLKVRANCTSKVYSVFTWQAIATFSALLNSE